RRRPRRAARERSCPRRARSSRSPRWRRRERRCFNGLTMEDDYRRTLERAVRHLGNGADAVCDDLALNRGVPRLNAMTGGYSFDNDYVWDSWADFQWAGFLAGRL